MTFNVRNKFEREKRRIYPIKNGFQRFSPLTEDIYRDENTSENRDINNILGKIHKH